MGCCVLAVVIVGQMLELWRRVKGFCGFSAELYPDPDLEPAPAQLPLGTRIRELLRKPAARAGLALLLIAEAAAAGTWLWRDHKEHLQTGMAHLVHLLPGERFEPEICSSGTVASAPQDSLQSLTSVGALSDALRGDPISARP